MKIIVCTNTSKDRVVLQPRTSPDGAEALEEEVNQVRNPIRKEKWDCDVVKHGNKVLVREEMPIDPRRPFRENVIDQAGQCC